MEKEEFLKLLPKLIRDDDEVKGAIITALSGIVATKEDIKELIKEFDKRFETMQKQMNERFEAMDKRFETMQKQMNERFEAMDKRFEALQIQIDTNYNKLKGSIDNLGGRTGKSHEKMVIKLLQQYNKLKDIDINKIKQIEIIDEKGTIFPEGYRTDIDVLMENGKTILIEIKFKADNRDIYHFVQVSKLYEKIYKKPDELWILTFEISPKTYEVSTKYPVKVIYGEIK
ncbi:MAG: hypothetical protein ACTSQJ_17220 [Promethearchaeota archaeon]